MAIQILRSPRPETIPRATPLRSQRSQVRDEGEQAILVPEVQPGQDDDDESQVETDDDADEEVETLQPAR